ncbi:MogA/MoaB family molybdenum cofactor biosynthesis protein [Quadrisphaera granulorum]|nr:MogA/MoaB family molybdenum cofactor biosynthesis protein [Quadrisphaera granulorum]
MGSTPPRSLVITVSNRAAAGVYEDTAGPVLVAGLRAAGFAVDGPQIVPDGDPVGAALRAAIAAGYAVVVTTGGTGLNPHDATPEQTAPLLDRPVPGIAEALRATGLAKGVATAMLSRGVAGLAGSTLVVNVAGSPGACCDAVEVLAAVLPHAVDQRRGGDHPRSAPA